jgi:hypothetical protein
MCIDKSGLACCLNCSNIFLQRWREICTILQPMGSKGQCLKNLPKPADQKEARKPELSTRRQHYKAKVNSGINR